MEVIQRELFTRVWGKIRRSVHSRLRILCESGEMSVVDTNKLVVEKGLIPSLDL